MNDFVIKEFMWGVSYDIQKEVLSTADCGLIQNLFGIILQKKGYAYEI